MSYLQYAVYEIQFQGNHVPYTLFSKGLLCS